MWDLPGPGREPVSPALAAGFPTTAPPGKPGGATLHRGAQDSHYRGLSCCGAQAPDVQAQ